MMLAISGILALICLLGVGFVVTAGPPLSVDGLFMSLILLTMSLVFGGTALYEFRKRGTAPLQAARAGARPAAVTVSGSLLQRGRVASVQFFESNVGQPNKSIVMLSNGENPASTLVFEGDVRNALPVGQKVEVSFRKESGHNVLVNVHYA